jgi:hypothetical protein
LTSSESLPKLTVPSATPSLSGSSRILISNF